MADGAVEIYDVETGEKICRVQGASGDLRLRQVVGAMGPFRRCQGTHPGSKSPSCAVSCQLEMRQGAPMLRQPAACPQRHLVAQQPTGDGSLWPYGSDLRCEEGTENLQSK
jgi:hypothetical protein